MSFVVAPIVEGHGDVQALPVLLRMIDPTLQIARPVRFPRSKLIKQEHLVRAAAIAAANIIDRGAIFLLIDADEDCAAQLGPELERYLSERFPSAFAELYWRCDNLKPGLLAVTLYTELMTLMKRVHSKSALLPKTVESIRKLSINRN